MKNKKMQAMCDNDNIRLSSLNSNKELAQKISDNMGVELSSCRINRFADGEVQIDIDESIRNDIIFVIQSTSTPVNENLMELLIFIDALKRASAREINIVMPYFGYSRQDRKSKARQPISSKLVANLIQTAGANRVITIDLHAPQIQGFFDIPTDHLTALLPIKKYVEENILTKHNIEDIVIISPDHGGVKRARQLAKLINCPIAIIDKRRPKPNVAEVSSIVGEIEGKICIMIDDIADTAGTLCKGADALIEKGALEVYGICVHGILSDPAIENIRNSKIKKLVITDTITLPKEKQCDEIEVISVDKLLAIAIENVYKGTSISHIFGEN